MLTYRIYRLRDRTRVLFLYNDPRPPSDIELVGIIPDYRIVGDRESHVVLLVADDWDPRQCLEEAERRGLIEWSAREE